MKITNILEKYPLELRQFVQFLIDKKLDYKAILVDDNFMGYLGYLLSFLESLSIYIIVDHHGYAVYKQFAEDRQVLIECEFMLKHNVEQRYLVGVIKAFTYINKPF